MASTWMWVESRSRSRLKHKGYLIHRGPQDRHVCGQSCAYFKRSAHGRCSSFKWWRPAPHYTFLHPLYFLAFDLDLAVDLDFWSLGLCNLVQRILCAGNVFFSIYDLRYAISNFSKPLNDNTQKSSLDGVEKMGPRQTWVPGSYSHSYQHLTQNGHSNCVGAVYCSMTNHTIIIIKWKYSIWTAHSIPSK